MASTGSPPPPCSRGDPHRRPAVQAIPTAAMPARRPPSPLCPTGDPYRRAVLRAIRTTALLSRSSPPPPPREIPAAALPSGKMRLSPKMSLKEGYYILEDKEGFVFQEYDGGYYFLECFKGEGFYYHSEESDYFQAGQSLYDKAHGLQTLDAKLQRLTLDANNSGKVDEALGSGGKVAQGLHGDFDKPGLHRDFEKLGLRFHKQGQGLCEDFDNLGLRFHKQGQVLEEHCKGFRVPEDRCKGGQALDDDFVDGDSPCLKALEASGVSGRRLFARRV